MPALTVTGPAGGRSARRDPLDDRLGRDPRALLVAARQQDRELVAAEPEGLAALAQVRGQLGEHLVAGGMAEAVVDLLEVVDVHEAEAERIALRLRVGELALEPVVEVAVVAELGERVGERQAHRAQLTEGRALVERDREQRPDERAPTGTASAARGSTSISAAEAISANGMLVTAMLVRATVRNGLCALTPTTRLIRIRLTV